MRAGLLVAVASLATAAAVAACQTVNLGSPPADVNACRPSQAFFVSDICPKVLDMSYGGKKCSDANCHGISAGRPFTLTVPTCPNSDGGASATDMDWMANYRSAAEHMNCTNVKASELLALPTGMRIHGGGMLFAPDSPEALAIQMWPTVQP